MVMGQPGYCNSGGEQRSGGGGEGLTMYRGCGYFWVSKYYDNFQHL